MAKEIPVDELTYEQALGELEKLVSELEGGERSLEDSMGLFERGQQLAERCTALLDQADLKVEQLTGKGDLEDFQV